MEDSAQLRSIAHGTDSILPEENAAQDYLTIISEKIMPSSESENDVYVESDDQNNQKLCTVGDLVLVEKDKQEERKESIVRLYRINIDGACMHELTFINSN